MNQDLFQWLTLIGIAVILLVLLVGPIVRR